MPAPKHPPQVVPTFPTGTRIPEFTLGERLRKALDDTGIEVQEMARHLNVGRNTVGRYMSGATKPPYAVIVMWSHLTGVDLQWLLTGVEKPAEAPTGGRARRSAGGGASRTCSTTAPDLVPAC